MAAGVVRTLRMRSDCVIAHRLNAMLNRVRQLVCYTKPMSTSGVWTVIE